jgi:hypothetical protein
MTSQLAPDSFNRSLGRCRRRRGPFAPSVVRPERPGAQGSWRSPLSFLDVANARNLMTCYRAEPAAAFVALHGSATAAQPTRRYRTTAVTQELADSAQRRPWSTSVRNGHRSFPQSLGSREQRPNAQVQLQAVDSTATKMLLSGGARQPFNPDDFLSSSACQLQRLVRWRLDERLCRRPDPSSDVLR